MTTKKNKEADGPHNETVHVRSSVKAGALTYNHNETLLDAIRVRTNLKGGSVPECPE